MESGQSSSEIEEIVITSTTLSPLTLDETKKITEFLKKWKDMTPNEFEENVLSLITIDPTKLFSPIKEYMRVCKENMTSEVVKAKDSFMKRLLNLKPCCYFARFWKLYLKFALEYRSLLFSENPSAESSAKTPIEPEILERFESAISVLPTSWSLSELFLRNTNFDVHYSESLRFQITQIFNKMRLNVGAHVKSSLLWLSLLKLYIKAKKVEEIIEILELMCTLPFAIEEKETLLHLFNDPILSESLRFQQLRPTFIDRLINQGVSEVVLSRKIFLSSLRALRDKHHFTSLFDAEPHTVAFQSELWVTKMYELWFKEIENLEKYVATLNSNEQRIQHRAGIDVVNFTYRKLIDKLRKYPSQMERMFEIIQTYAARLSELTHEQDTSSGCAHPHFARELISLKKFLLEDCKFMQHTVVSNPKFYLSLAAVEMCLYGPLCSDNRSFSEAFQSAQNILEEALNQNEDWRRYPEPSLVSALIRSEILFNGSSAVLNTVRSRFEQAIQIFNESLQRETVCAIREKKINNLVELWLDYANVETQFEQYKAAARLYERALCSSEIASLPSLWLPYVSLLLKLGKVELVHHVYSRALKSVHENYKSELWQHYWTFYQEKFKPNIILEDLKKITAESNNSWAGSYAYDQLAELVDNDVGNNGNVIISQTCDGHKAISSASDETKSQNNETQNSKEHELATESISRFQCSSSAVTKDTTSTSIGLKNGKNRRSIPFSNFQSKKRSHNHHIGPPMKRLHVGQSSFRDIKHFSQSTPSSLRFVPPPKYVSQSAVHVTKSRLPPVNKRSSQVATSPPSPSPSPSSSSPPVPTRESFSRQGQTITPSRPPEAFQGVLSDLRQVLPGLSLRTAFQQALQEETTSFNNTNSLPMTTSMAEQQNQASQAISLLEQLLNQLNAFSKVANSQPTAVRGQTNLQILKNIQSQLQKHIQQQESSETLSTITTTRSQNIDGSIVPRPLLVCSQTTNIFTTENSTTKTDKNEKSQSNNNLSTSYKSWKYLPPNTSEIAPDVPFHHLLQLDEFLKDRTIFDIIKSLQRIVDLKEQDIKQRREYLFLRQNEKKKILNFIHKIRLNTMGAEKYALIQEQNERERAELERTCQEEFNNFERQISEEMDEEAAEQQMILQRAAVPGIFNTKSRDEIRIQSQILALIMSSINRGVFTAGTKSHGLPPSIQIPFQVPPQSRSLHLSQPPKFSQTLSNVSMACQSYSISPQPDTYTIENTTSKHEIQSGIRSSTQNYCYPHRYQPQQQQQKIPSAAGPSYRSMYQSTATSSQNTAALHPQSTFPQVASQSATTVSNTQQQQQQQQQTLKYTDGDYGANSIYNEWRQ